MSSDSFRLLLIEDDDGDAVLAERALASCGDDFEVQRVETLTAALEALQDQRFDIVLMDLSLPDSFGLSGVQRLRESAPHISLVVLTGLSDSQSALAALELGVQDYLLKGEWSAESLKRTLHYARQRNAILQENQRLLCELRKQARVDALTQLLNRQALTVEFDREWSRTLRTSSPLSCVMLDVDFFKKVNDTHGHAAGDAVLRAVAECLNHECRLTDVGARYGGEEFCILLSDTDEPGALTWAERTRHAIESLVIPVDGMEISVTASFGVAHRNETCKTPEQLIDQADQALLVAKQSGRNRVCRFSQIQRDDRGGEPGSPLQDKLSEVTAADVMTSFVATLTPERSLVDAARFLFDLRVDSAPVVDSQGRLLGVVNEEDLVGPLSVAGTSDASLASVMNQRPTCFGPHTPVRAIYDFLRRVSLRRVYIVAGQRPLGIVSRTSLLRWLCNDLTHACRDREHGSHAALGALRELEQQVQLLLTEFTDAAEPPPGRVVVAGSQMQALVEDLMAHTRQAPLDDASLATLQRLLS